jgi:hypothetical protein
MSEYAHPETVIGTDWVDEHLSDEKVKLVEVDVDMDATLPKSQR